MKEPTAISKYGLDLINISPQDYWWNFLREPREAYVEDEKTIFEKAFRCAVLQPEEFKKKYVECPKFDKRNPHQKTEYLSLLSRCEANNQILLEFDYKGNSYYKMIIDMQKAVEKHSVAKVLFSTGNIGFAEILIEPESGAYVEFTPHWVSGDIIVNLMSTGDATEDYFQKEVLDKKLHKKAAIHMDGLHKHTFIFVNVEKTQPCKIAVRVLDEDAIELGRMEYTNNCRTYMECLESGIWPGLPEKITQLSLPNWAFKDKD